MLPPLSAPTFSLEIIKDLAPTAFAVTLFALTEAVSIGRSLAMRSGQRIDGNQEFVGQGLSKLAGSFFSGYVATGSFNRSGLNYRADLLEREAARLRAAGGDLFLCKVKPQVMAVLRSAHSLDVLGADHVFESKTGAIAAIQPQLDGDRCARCSARVFSECPRTTSAHATV